MAALPPRRRDGVYACLSKAFRDTLDELADTSRQPMLAEDRITDIISALRDVFDAAMNDVSRDWDFLQRNGDLLALLGTLPAELSSECLRQLTLRECIAVSHVSRAWRRTVLTDRSLWARYDLPQTQLDVEVAAEALATLLARSHPLPFQFERSWSSEINIPSALYDLVFANLDRMAELHLDDIVPAARLMNSDAPLPLLKRLVCHSAGSGNFYKFPAYWGARNVPRLEHLMVWGFVLPADCQPFAALRTLWAYVPEDHTPSVSFSAVFPHLTSLELKGVTAAALPMLTPPPPALQTLSLVVHWQSDEDPIDYSRLFRSVCVPCKIRKLHVDYASGLLDALKLFVRTFHGLWNMEIADRSVYLRDLDSAAEWSIHVRTNDPLRLEQEQNGAAFEHLQRLAELALPLVAFPALHRERVSLPRLQSLVLDVNDYLEVTNLDPLTWLDLPSGQIALPALDFVKLWCPFTNVIKILLTGAAHGLLSALLAGRAKGSITTVYIYTHELPSLSQEDVAPLLQLVKRVLVGTYSENPEDAQLVFSRSAEAGASR